LVFFSFFFSDALTLINRPSTNQAGDGNLILDELLLADTQAKGPFAFLKGAMDMSRVAASGHSAGGGAVSTLGNRVDVRIFFSPFSFFSCDMRTLENEES
jgi:hypothetical protein